MRNLMMLACLTAACASCKTTPSAPATPVSTPPTTQAVAVPVPGPVITRLVYRSQTIVVRAGDAGPSYSLETSTGQVLVTGMTLDQVAAKQPEMFQKIRAATATVWAGADCDSY